MVRIHTQIETRADVITEIKKKFLKTQKMTLESILKNKMLPYSAIKIIANPPAPYSTLNPDTNSLSPSEKSKGVRLVSASLEITQRTKIRGLNKKILT